ELKTPLTSIHGFSQLLRDGKIAIDTEKRNRYLEIIDKESMRLSKLVTEILDLSRIDLGTLKFAFEEVDLGALLDSVKKEMEVPIKAKGLKSEYDLEKDLPKIVTDRERLTQILMNLITNSIKYTPEGKITVTAKREGGSIRFSVADTGIGIAKENHPKIFQRFYQVDSSYTRKASGNGLGLSLCKEFVARLGGRIWFESSIGKGSAFHFTLPLKSKEPVSREDAHAASSNPLDDRQPKGKPAAATWKPEGKKPEGKEKKGPSEKAKKSGKK
ncbi:MAG: HAMP domain-containing sensor histidine kinase, partial [Candidatus Aenigmatarchaeota archaeon]